MIFPLKMGSMLKFVSSLGIENQLSDKIAALCTISGGHTAVIFLLNATSINAQKGTE